MKRWFWPVCEIVFVIAVSCIQIRYQGYDFPARQNLPLKERLRGPAAGAHQGNIFSFKFNTLAGFETALNSGADIVELDLRISRDGVPVVYHDKNLSSWTNCPQNVSDLKVEELKRCRFFANSESVPTFEEVLRWSQGRIVVNGEFKESEVIKPAIGLVKKYAAYEWVYFQAKSFAQYKIARAFDGKVFLLFAPKNQKELEDVLGLNDDRITVIELHPPIRTPENIKAIHKAGKLASEDAWHFDSFYEFFGAACSRVFELGIDIAISNRPDSCARQKDRFK